MVVPDHDHSNHEDHPTDYDRTEWPWKAVVAAIVGVVLFTAFGFVISALFMRMRTGSLQQPGLPSTREEIVQEFPEPRLRPLEFTEWLYMKKREANRLNTYGWVDRAQGVVHIPIDRAMELLLERGLPVRENPYPAKIGGVLSKPVWADVIAETAEASETPQH